MCNFNSIKRLFKHKYTSVATLTELGKLRKELKTCTIIKLTKTKY